MSFLSGLYVPELRIWKRLVTMKNLYEKIAACNPNQENVVLTGADSEIFGEKALLTQGQIVWEQGEKHFFHLHEQEAAACEFGLVEIDGKKVFCEGVGTQKKLVICGAGHVSIPIIKIGIMLGFEIMVIEDRPSFADHARAAGAANVVCDSFEHALAEVEGDRDTYFVIVTRGHRYDLECLQSIAQKEHAYIGMIGSKKRVALVKETLAERGTNPQVLENLYSPIGLNIGAQTPEEIAVAIMAEIIEVKSRRNNNSGYTKEIVKELAGIPEGEQRVLCTIVQRKGSAPRGVGTKMVVRPDQAIVGTIGGGCAEAAVLSAARRMLAGIEPPVKLEHADMTNSDAEAEGMVCGGVIDVLLELIS